MWFTGCLRFDLKRVLVDRTEEFVLFFLVGFLEFKVLAYHFSDDIKA